MITDCVFPADSMHEACGIAGVFLPPTTAADGDAARALFFALFALNHRGQESAGMATCDGEGVHLHKDMGLVAQVFNETNLAPLRGHFGIGHTRYATTGGSVLRNAQPYLIETLHGPLAVAHNGNLTNVGQLRQDLLRRGVGLISTSDTEVITQMLAVPNLAGATPFGLWLPEGAWEDRIAAFMERAQGAYCLAILTREALYAVRDPWGLRPLCLGRLEWKGATGYAFASESCALSTIGATFVREVEPGEIVRVDADGFHSTQGRPPERRAFCSFEYVYFARPDAVFEGQTVHHVRQALGRQLAREAPADADLVVGVPDSSTPAAIGYALESGIPFSEGFTKNRYIARTFIQPGDHLRKMGVRLKYNPLHGNLAGKRVVMVDDSIVRGNTAGPLVQLLREGGATEVHVRVSSPPVRWPCFMGIDMPTRDELIASQLDVEAIRRTIGADSLAYLSLEGLLHAIRSGIPPDRPCGHCHACFSGEYPLPLPTSGPETRPNGLS
ncbi:MAG: amidophosphoribosyltransferase [Caldilineales bacterium]|nr:amidophosphoribosyltransferase [Caldilineales bacterium]